MTDSHDFPECLRRPDAGGHVQSRIPKTEKGHRIRFEGMIRTLRKRNRWVAADAYDLAIAIGAKAGQYTRNTLKQYHAAVRQNLRDRWIDGSLTLEEVDHIDQLLRSHRPAPTSRKAKDAKTSARRAKSVRPEQISALTTVLLSDATPIRQIAAAMLDYGVELATRPGEFLTLGQDPNGRFWVRSAKHSLENRRGLQRARTVPAENYEAWEIAELQTVIQLIAEERAQGATFSKLLRRCQYAGQMVHAVGPRKPGPIGAALGESRWVDVNGDAESKWCPAEGEAVISMLTALAAAGVQDPDVFIITPFKVIEQEMRRRLDREAGLLRSLGVKADEWPRDRVGTIHTFQGREADTVILMLGAPKASQHRARQWAASPPNIINVAVSRAKQNLYVVGSATAWSAAGSSLQVLQHALTGRS